MTDPIATEKPSRLYTLSKILFCAIAFLFVIFTVLANMGGNSQFHKDSIEQLAAEMTGFKSTINYLVNVTYFPTISVDFEDMEMFRGIDTAPVAHIDKLQAALSFWSVMWRDGRIKVLNVQGLHLSTGVILDKPVNMDSLAIVDENAATGRLAGQGHVGNTALAFSMDMSAKGSGRKRIYWFEPERVLRLELGDIKISAVLRNAMNPYLSLQDLKITREGKDIIAGRLDVSKRREREITFGGELVAVENGTVFKPDLVYDMAARKLSGTIKSENFKPQDFAEKSQVDELLNRFVEYLGDLDKDGKALDTFFSGQDVTLDAKGAAAYASKLKFENNTLSLK